MVRDSDSDEDKGPIPSSGSRDRTPAEPKPKPKPSKPPEGAKCELFDPFKFPDGRPVPQGFDWDGVRPVRNKKGCKRPAGCQHSGITIHRTNARKTLPDGAVKSICIGNVCAGNQGMRLQLCR